MFSSRRVEDVRSLVLLFILTSSLVAGGIRNNVGFDQSYDVLPHIVFGGTWVTTITLVNMGHEPVQVPISFFGEDGEPLEVPIQDVGAYSELTVGIAAHGGISLLTENHSSEPEVEGWVKLDLTCCTAVSGMAIFRQRTNRNDSEAVVPLSSSVAVSSTMIFDNTDGFITGLAMVNPSETSVATITANFRRADGTRIYLDQFTMNPREHRAVALPDAYPQTKNLDGTIEFLSYGGTVALLGLRFSPGGAFTSMHSLDPPPVQ
jgi:hypothetical protein